MKLFGFTIFKDRKVARATSGKDGNGTPESAAEKEKENVAASSKATTPPDCHDKRLLSVWRLVKMLIVIGVICIICLNVRNFQLWPTFIININYGLSAMGVLIAGAAFCGGGLLGFIFGIPSLAQDPDLRIKYNDNLVQISDWLTKIIVGVGLTQLTKIPHRISLLGWYLHDSIGIGGIYGRNAALAIVLYFLTLGFLLIYFWSKTEYTQILKYVDDELISKLKKEKDAAISGKEAAEQEVKTIEKQKEEEKKQAVKAAKVEGANAVMDIGTETINSSDPGALDKIQERQKGNPRILTFAEFRALLATAEEKMQKGISGQAAIPDRFKDPNKGQWGGLPEKNYRKVTAEVAPIDDTKLFKLKITVSSTDLQKPLNNGDVVLFSLHPTFKNPYKIATVSNGVAQLEAVVFGSFTVGVLCDNGATELEYDLSEIPGAPTAFKDN